MLFWKKWCGWRSTFAAISCRVLAAGGKCNRSASWEALDGGRDIEMLSAMNCAPVLKFNLKWVFHETVLSKKIVSSLGLAFMHRSVSRQILLNVHESYRKV